MGPTGPAGATGPTTQTPWTSLITAANFALVDVKTITFAQEFQNGNSGTTASIDWTAAQKQAVTLSAATVSFVFNPAPLGVGNFLLRVVQDGTGGRLALWPTTIKWVGGKAPTLTPTAAAIDITSFYYNATNYYGQYGTAFA